MSGSGSFAVSRSHGDDRFYNPPAMRRQQQQQQQQLQKQQQQQQQQQKQPLQRAAKVEAAAAVAEVGNRTDSDDSTNTATLSKTPSVCSASPPRPPINVTNLDRLMESVTPFVPAQHFSEVNVRGRRTREAEPNQYYCLGDLWEAFSEWSVYGVGVPILLNGKDSIIQYYVPFLSGIQLYVDPSKPSSRISMLGGEGDAESSRETSSGGSSDCEVERRSISSSDGLRNQHSLVNLNAQRLNRLSLSDKAVMGSLSDESEMSKSLGQLMFEYLEHEQPHHRRPLADKIAVLASQFPELKKCRSSDLLPSSWISVAWYPIYRIPMGPTLRDLDASFLTFHALSTQSRALSTGQPRYHGATGKKVLGNVNACSRISLPVFGLATYKLKSSILSPCGPHESEQENSLLQAADSWLRRLHVILPDYQFFRLHYSPWK